MNIGLEDNVKLNMLINEWTELFIMHEPSLNYSFFLFFWVGVEVEIVE